MADSTFNQQGQSVEQQFNAAGDIHYQAAPPPHPSGRIIGPWPGYAAYFTGREDVLRAIHAALGGGDAAVTPPPQALNGMPGVGKTTVAAQYVAYRWDCFTVEAWLPAERIEGLEAALAELGPSLSPPIPVTGDAKADYRAVLLWFASRPGWLIVADNVEDPQAVRRALPPTATGRLLMTTRREDPGGGAVAVRVERMSPETGATFLLRRAGHLGLEATLAEADPEWCEGALALSERFDGLPLALAQAGAYLASRKTAPARYLERFDAERAKLLNFAGDVDHATVTATFRVALEAVEAIPEYGPAAAQLVRLCAFLAPDPIPDEVFLGNVKALEEPLQSRVKSEAEWDEVVEAATRFAMLDRDPDARTLSFHRLAADVLRDVMDLEVQRTEASIAVRAINYRFPNPDYKAWVWCARILPHAATLVGLIYRLGIVSEEVSGLLTHLAAYLLSWGQFSQAERYFRRSLEMDRSLYHGDHPELAESLNNLGAVLNDLGKYSEAEEVLLEAVELDGRIRGQNKLRVAAHLGNLGATYYFQHRYPLAEKHLRRALSLTEEKAGPKHPFVALRLNSLALVLEAEERFKEAYSLRDRDMRITRSTRESEHPEYATSLLNYGRLCILSGKWDRAYKPLTKAMKIRDRIYEGRHTVCANPRFWLANWHFREMELERAQELLYEALEIDRGTIGLDHPDALAVIQLLAEVNLALKKRQSGASVF